MQRKSVRQATPFFLAWNIILRSFLMSFVGAVDCSPFAVDGDATNGCGEDKVVDGEKSAFVSAGKNPRVSDLQCTTSNNEQLLTNQVSHATSSPLCRAVTAAVYVDMRDSELRARNVVISGLSEGRGQSDKDAAANLLVDELNLKADIIHCKRLGKHIASKIRPMLVTFDSVECAAACMEKAKLLRKSTNDCARTCLHQS